MRIGSLFSGAGGLDLAVEAVFGGRTVWQCEQDPAASKVLAYRWPGVTNLGDITKVDWSQVGPVDVLCGGYPCQPFSVAGGRNGTNDERHLWPYFAEAISALTPRFVVLENVAGHLTLGFDQVVGDLSIMGYRASWCSITASSVGAPHRRERIFVLAEDVHERRVCSRFGRRRGLHRDSVCRRLVPSSAEGVDVRQGAASLAADGANLRREDHLRAEARPEAPRRLHLESLGCSGCGGHSADQAPADSEGATSGHCAGVSGDGRSVPATAERPGELDRVDAETGGDVRRPDSRCESSGTGPDTSEPGTTGDLPGRPVVGAERWAVRTDSVRGPIPEVRDDAVGPGLRAAASGHGPVDLLPTPSVADGEGGHLTRSGARSGELLLPGVARAYGRGELLPTPTSRDHKGRNQRGDNTCLPGALLPTLEAKNAHAGPDYARMQREGSGGHELLPTPNASDATDGGTHPDHREGHSRQLIDYALLNGTARWGKYGPAIHRWEMLTRPAPSPTEPNTKGNPRLAAAFAEWMMGWPAGWCTDPAISIGRNDQLRIIGNGVVPQQAAAAIRFLCGVAQLELFGVAS